MTGEEHHERCRYGSLTEAWRVSGDGLEKACVLPLCGWELPEDAPTPVRRVWGGNLVEPETDCLGCPAYSPL
jgi:hypothetical protein